ncbi:MAG: hypothetical protein LBT62_01375, partial [Deltaproteobacteria bacterium]|nr:hypothetical protein [Deltaproteobacteria bacterium]
SDALREYGFSNPAIENIARRFIDEGRNVYLGSFSDQASSVENFLCSTKILISNDDIYLNSEDDGY